MNTDNIITSYPAELSKKQLYLLTMNNQTLKMADCDGQILDIQAWAVYTDSDFTSGEEKEILSILTKEGDVLATISETFKRDFLKMAAVFGEELEKIEVVTGKTKNGRTYVTCKYAE